MRRKFGNFGVFCSPKISQIWGNPVGIGNMGMVRKIPEIPSQIQENSRNSFPNPGKFQEFHPRIFQPLRKMRNFPLFWPIPGFWGRPNPGNFPGADPAPFPGQSWIQPRPNSRNSGDFSMEKLTKLISVSCSSSSSRGSEGPGEGLQKQWKNWKIGNSWEFLGDILEIFFGILGIFLDFLGRNPKKFQP